MNRVSLLIAFAVPVLAVIALAATLLAPTSSAQL